MQLVTSTADSTQSVPAALAQTAWLWEMNEGEMVMARQHADMAIISEGHKEVVNIRTAGAASEFSAANAIRIRILIRPNSSQIAPDSTIFTTRLYNNMVIEKFTCIHYWTPP